MDSNNNEFNPEFAMGEVDMPEKKGPTALSIVAMVCAVICAPIGFILSIIDLFRRHGRKKFLSIIALIVSILFTLVGSIVIILLLIMVPSFMAYEEKAYVAQDTMLCDEVRAALTTTLLDPEVVSSDNPGLPPTNQWVYVGDIDTSTDFGRIFEDMMGMRTGAIEGRIKSSYQGGRASGIRFMIDDNNQVVVEIEYSDMTGERGNGTQTTPISTNPSSPYSYYQF